MEKILFISETTFGDMDGWIVTTDQQEIKIGIDNGQSCCEDWGYFSSEDNLEDYVGANLLSINLVDSALNVSKLEDLAYVDKESCVFVNIETSVGTFQLTVYNEHNGYYSHRVIVDSRQLEEEFWL